MSLSITTHLIKDFLMSAATQKPVSFMPSLMSAYDYAKNIVADISAKYRWLGRKIKRVTNDTMSPELAKIVQLSYQALPFAVIRLAFPFPWVIIPTTAVIICKIALSSPHHAISFDDLQNGIGLANLGLGSFQIIDGFASANLLELVYGVANLVSAGWFFARTGLFREVLSCNHSTNRHRAAH
jgi:hypothetical protein